MRRNPWGDIHEYAIVLAVSEGKRPASQDDDCLLKSCRTHLPLRPVCFCLVLVYSSSHFLGLSITLHILALIHEPRTLLLRSHRIRTKLIYKPEVVRYQFCGLLMFPGVTISRKRRSQQSMCICDSSTFSAYTR